MLAIFGLGEAIWSIFVFFVFVMWIMLVFNVFGDIFRSTDMSGVVKVLWMILVISTPYLGVFLYLIIRGGKMAERQAAAAQQQEAFVRGYIAEAAGGGSTASELARLGELKEKGLIDDAEFAAAKAKILS